MRCCILLLLGLAAPCWAEWKPAPGPLMTRWGKKLDPKNVLAEYPRPQLVRSEWVNLNGLWDYAITPKDAATPAKWDGEILVPFCPESSLSGVGKQVGASKVLWYKRSFAKPKVPDGHRVKLNFDAVDWHCKVFVNGKQVGDHEGGFDPFTVDITDVLRAGEQQELVVWVWDPTDEGSQPVGKQIRNPHGIWYTSVSGIWQTVWLEVVPPGAIQSIRPVTDITTKKVTVNVTTFDKHAEQVRITVLAKGKAIAQGTGKVSSPITIAVPDAQLWTPDTPHLYDLKVQTLRGETVLDDVGSYFAMRSISMGKDEQGHLRLLLNNKPLFHWGPLDQGWWPDGLLTPPSDEALAYDLKVLKDLGMNMLRKHIKVEPSRLYYHCDKLGLLVWQDMPSAINRTKKHFVAPNAPKDAEFDVKEQAIFRKELKAMMDHLSFFPCIVVWVPFNEGWGQHNTNDVLRWTMQYDPTRLVDGPSGWADRGIGHMKDLHQYPGPGMFAPMADRVSVLGEFGGLGLPIKGHLWKDADNWGYRTYKTTDELRENYRRLMVQLPPLIGKGLAAAVYTQTTDVEVEVNGLMTYDREIIKFDVKETAQWHRRLFAPPPTENTLLPTSERVAQAWRYTLTKPGADWFQPAFDDAKWEAGKGGFGTKMTPGSVIGTEWSSKDIWLRRPFELKELPKGEVFLRLHHDEDTDIYINGVLAAQVLGYTTDYTIIPISREAAKALKEGKNTLAVHCRQTGGGQYIDVGLVELIEKK